MQVESEVIGREQELRQLLAFLDGRPGALLLDGPPGIGKTTLWQRGVDEASHRSFRVLRATPRSSELELSLAGLGDLLSPFVESVLPALPAPQRRALASALLVDETDAKLERTALAAACLSSLRELAASGSVLIAIDDVQWLDRPSARLLGYAARRLTTESVWLLLTRRPTAPGEPPPLDLDRALAGRDLACLEVGPLSLGALQRLLRLRLGATFSRPILARIREASGGNPLYALELARWVMRREVAPRPGRPLSLPPSLRHLIGDRLAAQPQEVRRMLATVAALSRPTADAIGDEAALAAAREAGLVEPQGDELVFTHPLIAAAAYDTLAPSERRRLHGELAGQVADAEERARHLALSVVEPRADVAATLEDAARQAAGRGAPDGAAALMELAVELTPSGQEANRISRRLALGEYVKAVGDHLRAQEVFAALVADLPPGPLRARALHGAAGGTGGVVRSRTLHERALAEAGTDAALRTNVHVTLSVLKLVEGDLQTARDDARKAVASATATDDHGVRARALGNLGLLDALAGNRHDDGWWQRALAEEAAATEPIAYGPRQTYAMALMYADRLDAARQLMVEARHDAIEHGRVNVQSSLDLHLVELECRAGNLEPAREYAEEQYLLALQPGVGQPEGGALYGLALVSMYEGQVQEARRLAKEGLVKADSFGDHIFRAQNLAVLGFLELSVGDPVAACSHLEGLADELLASGHGEPSVYPVLPNTIEALIRVGRHNEARRLLEILEEQGRRLDSTWALTQASRNRALLTAEEGDLTAAIQHLASAMVEHERLPVPFERGRTLLVLGQTLRRAKRWRQARDALTDAMAIFERIGTPIWSEHAHEELARIGGRRAQLGLTPTERRVADLVADGLSNKEVAAALFVTVSSVERHLTRIYDKLGVASRVELASRDRGRR
ncbi:MAG: AAA family ATPase [Chloroflexota bacterium]|nr:AAA family ATPase [Chloroflexota bacterium]